MPVERLLSSLRQSDLSATTMMPNSTYRERDIILHVNAGRLCQWMNERAETRFGARTGSRIDELLVSLPKLYAAYERVAAGRTHLLVRDAGEVWRVERIDPINHVISISASAFNSSPTQPKPEGTWTLSCAGDADGERAGWQVHLDESLADALNLPAQVPAVSFRPIGLDPPAIRAITRAVLGLVRGRAPFFSREAVFAGHGGHFCWVRVHAMVITRDSGGRVTQIAGSVQDITGHKLLAEDQDEMEQRLMRSQKMESIARLTGGIAHDFNNILATILGYAELSMMEPAASEAGSMLSTYLQEIYQAGRRARELVAHMRTFSRSDNTNPEHLDVAEEIRDAVKMMRASFPASVEIRLDLADDTARVFLDKSFLQQLLMNVCINACDAMSGVGSITIGVRSQVVSGRQCASCHSIFSGQFVEVSIEDTGRGISPDVLDRLFEPYAGDGPGMGLAVVHGILHKHGGHVRVDTIQHDGAEFRFYLPISDTGVAFVPAPAAPVDADKGHILVIDDEISIAYYLRELLVRRGFRVTVCSDSREAWDLFAAEPGQFDLVVTDQTMPGMSGMQLAARMLGVQSDLPIILCTGYSDLVDEGNVSDRGVRAIMPKPIDSAALIANIQRLLGEH